ncbi:unnamed protein product [Effrenium voratum]|uniref:Uncharacterized protein n=1 Tax=Effrenium voratum TaxID=2562239 RepID=A0AA36NEF1_9DINO|nr:unnamed protein product [Effrenium voratum]
MATMTNGAYRGRYVPGKVMFPTKVFNETEDTFESTLRKLNQEELPDTLDLLHALQEGAAERRWAMELLGAMVAVQPELGQQFKSEVLEALTDDDVKVKKAALELLPQLGVEHAADVVEFLTSSSPELRVTAAEALGKMGIWQLLEELRPCLADESSNVVKAGLGAVQRWGDNGQALASSVVSCLSHTCAGVRCEAVKALTSFAEAGERFAGRVAELLGDSDNQTKEAAVAYFERLGRRGLRRAEAVARDLCQRRACAAALALGHMGAEHCAAEVAQLLQNHEDLTLALSAAGLEPRVPVELRRPECAAAFALSLMGAEGGKYADSIAELLAQNAPPEMTASLIRSLASMGSFAGGHKGKLQAFLEHPQTVVREAACFAVGLMLKEGEALLPRLQDSQAPVRRQAALALGQLQDAALYVDTLAVLLDDSVPAVQAAALEALGQCGQESHAYACAVCRLAAPDTQAAMHSLVRCSALKTLGAMEASGFAPEVAGCFQAEEPCVREAALKAFAAFGEDGKEFLMEVEMLRFKGLDELGGAPYEVLVSFKATVMYPYDVALAIFYELYSMCMPLLMPNLKLLPFFVFRGLHSGAEYHYVRNQSGQLFPGVGVGLPPFVPPMDTAKWFHASAAWSLRTDFAQFPHILRFGSVAELLQLLKSDWAQVARAMRRFNQETLSASAGLWAYAVAAALSGNAGIEREGQ